MTCQHCGAALPPFALFCGECGRSVSAPSVVPPVVERPIAPAAAPAAAPLPVVTAAVADSVPTPDSPPSADSAPSASVALAPCSTCGAVPERDDLYCAECGRPIPGDTRVIEPLPPAMPEPAHRAVAPAAEHPAVVPAPAVASPDPVVVPAPEAASPARDVESTRIVPRGTSGARFVLQFSTGESYTVLGSGLAGRNPRPEPGEYVDHLVTILDPGRSVSKTHFEFGQQAGVFWISDRHSGNGSVVREPGAEPRPCEPGRRYSIARGTRIDIGEQFVVVS